MRANKYITVFLVLMLHCPAALYANSVLPPDLVPQPKTIGAKLFATFNGSTIADATEKFPEVKANLASLETAPVTRKDLFQKIASGTLLFNGQFQVDPDPLLNLRLEISNPTDQVAFFVYQLTIPTDVTSGPTFNNSFATVELFDDNEDGTVGFGALLSASTFFRVIDDPMDNVAINGTAVLGESLFLRKSTTHKEVLFDTIGAGPNSDDFMGDGFNFLQFRTEGGLSPGDRAVITAMGCYSIDETYCPERYEIPAAVIPAPAALWLFGSALGLLGWLKRRPA